MNCRFVNNLNSHCNLNQLTIQQTVRSGIDKVECVGNIKMEGDRIQYGNQTNMCTVC